MKENESTEEKTINLTLHGIGLGIAIAGLVLIILKATHPVKIVTSSIYASILIYYYTISCIEHALNSRSRGKDSLKKLTHLNFLWLIEGITIPIILGGRKETFGWLVFLVSWCLTPAVIVYCVNKQEKHPKRCIFFTMIVEFLMVGCIVPFLRSNSIEEVGLFLFGSILNSIGYLLEERNGKFVHALSHFYIVLGSILYLFLLYRYGI